MRRKISYLSIGFVGAIGLSILLFAFVKASISSFTHDESLTYLHFPQQTFTDLITHEKAYSNNHLLNTIGMKYSEKLFGNSELALRLPNLLLLCVFLVYSALLFRKSIPTLFVSTFVLLSTNRLVIELFGMARGYGLSMGFMMMALYHFISSFHTRKTTNLVLFHVAATAAVLSNFTLLNFYVILTAVHPFILFVEYVIGIRDKWNPLKDNLTNILLLTLSTALLLRPIKRSLEFNNFNFGGDKGFYSSTVENLVYHLFQNYGYSEFSMLFTKILLTGIVLFSIALITIRTIQSDQQFLIQNRGLVVSGLLVFLSTIAMIVQHHLFDIDYPVSRFAAFLIPILLVNTGFLLSYFSQSKIRHAVQFIALLLATASVVGFVSQSNMRQLSEWGYDQDTKDAMEILASSSRPLSHTNDQKVRLGVKWLYEPTTNYYRLAKNLDWLAPIERDGLKPDDHYFYVSENQLGDLDSLDCTILFQSEESNAVLLKNHNASW